MSHQIPIRALSSEELETLEQWLKEQRIVLDLRTRRQFSDALPVAKIVKRYFPRLVDLHNYSPRNSVVLKLQSWEIFNSKVLKKLGMTMSKSALEQIASGGAGAIEVLLHELIPRMKRSSPRSTPATPVVSTPTPRTRRNQPNKLGKAGQNTARKAKAKEEKDPDINLRPSRSLSQILQRTPDLPPDVVTMPVNILVDGEVRSVPKKLIFYDSYKAALRECGEKDNYISSINQKAQYLESMIVLKEERIADLMEQLGKLSVSILSMRPMLSDNDIDTRINISTPIHTKSASEPFSNS